MKSWTCPLDAVPGPALTELRLGTAEHDTDRYAELTPGQARTVAAALIELADIAESATCSSRSMQNIRLNLLSPVTRP
jgi:hypothetical protein